MPTREILSRYIETLSSLLTQINSEELDAIAQILLNTCEGNGTVFVCGNGGSASTASHMACDLSKNITDQQTGRLRVISLTDNLSHFSAIANDLDYDQVFVEQLRNLMAPKDALVAISASGNSPNVIRAAEYSLSLATPVIAFTGFTGGRLRELSTHCLHVPCEEYGPVEDLHLVFNHLLVGVLRAMKASEPNVPNGQPLQYQ